MSRLQPDACGVVGCRGGLVPGSRLPQPLTFTRKRWPRCLQARGCAVAAEPGVGWVPGSGRWLQQYSRAHLCLRMTTTSLSLHQALADDGPQARGLRDGCGDVVRGQACPGCGLWPPLPAESPQTGAVSCPAAPSLSAQHLGDLPTCC